LDGAAVVGHDSLQLVEDRLERVFEAQRLSEDLRYRQERLGVLSCALELGDVVVDRIEADMLAVDPERHEHHLHVDQLPVPSYATSDPVGTTFLERLVGDVPALAAEVLVEDEVVDQTPDRLLRRVAEELRRRRVPARHSLIGIHDDDGDRADLDERLQLGQPAAGIRELGRAVALRHHRSTSRQSKAEALFGSLGIPWVGKPSRAQYPARGLGRPGRHSADRARDWTVEGRDYLLGANPSLTRRTSTPRVAALRRAARDRAAVKGWGPVKAPGPEGPASAAAAASPCPCGRDPRYRSPRNRFAARPRG
jgi:hypothetical protein